MNENRSAARFVQALRLADLPEGQCRVATIDGNVIAFFNAGGRVFAVDNRCPHMGFPLDHGSVKDCILTCHWHHARFDLATGGTFDQWADDMRAFPVRIADGIVEVDLAEHGNPAERHARRLGDGLERNIPLVIAKSVIALVERCEADPMVPFRAGLEFGVRNRREGWGSGLTTLTCMMNILPWLDSADRARALYHGLSSVARDCEGNAPHFTVRPLPEAHGDPEQLKRWFRQFVEVRDSEGAERCITSAVCAGASPAELAEMMFAAASDHRYLTIGHVLDFTNKAFEALDLAGWDQAEAVLASLARSYATGERMEESNQWRHPIDLIAILERAFESIPAALEQGRHSMRPWLGAGALVSIMLGEDPQAIADAMLDALREGCTPEELGGAVAYAAAMRVARLHTSNEFRDWDTAHHSFTYSNAVHQALLRAPAVETLRGAFDAAMSVYLNRFLNIPAARIPHPNGSSRPAVTVIAEIPATLDHQQQVNQAAALVAEHFATAGDDRMLIAALGKALLREDRDFHSIQSLEAALRQYAYLGRGEAGANVLIATARYLAAHSPTLRAQGQTFRIAERLLPGDKLFEGEVATS